MRGRDEERRLRVGRAIFRSGCGLGTSRVEGALFMRLSFFRFALLCFSVEILHSYQSVLHSFSLFVFLSHLLGSDLFKPCSLSFSILGKGRLRSAGYRIIFVFLGSTFPLLPSFFNIFLHFDS